MDEYRKAKRRKDFSDSEDDEDPFHNKSTGFGFGSPAKNRGLNATPTSIRADSITGKSRATSTTKAGAGGAMNVPGAAGGGKGQQAAAPQQ